jgi:HK97 gp10 family phage protein
VATRIKLNKREALIYMTAQCEPLGDQIAGEIAADAKRSAPIRTGVLRGSIYSERLPNGGTRLNWRIGATAAYAIFVEKGTRKMAAQPFLRPALYRRRIGRKGIVSGGAR